MILSLCDSQDLSFNSQDLSFNSQDLSFNSQDLADSDSDLNCSVVAVHPRSGGIASLDADNGDDADIITFIPYCGSCECENKGH